MSKKKIAAGTALLLMLTMVAACRYNRNTNSDDNDEKITIETASDAMSATSGAEVTDLWEDEAVEKKIDEINNIIDNNYYFDIDRDKQEEALYDGIMEGLDDPYSVYYTKEEFAKLNEDNSGEYVGIGAVVTQDADMLVSIVRPIVGSPAEEAGLLAGDIVVEVDGTEIVDQELELVVDMIRGEEGTSAHLKIYRPDAQEYMEFDVPRRVVENVSVTAELLENQVGYVQVTQFYKNTGDEFVEALESLEAQGVKGVIVDMRDNPGGLLNIVVDMCSYLIDGGNVVTIEDKTGRVLQAYRDNDEHRIDIPMVVLVNGNSASAAEIFAGALQDTGIGKLVGTTTYGKGIVQSVIPLSDGSAVKLTIAKYFTPNGNDIHGKGIEPDYRVELPENRSSAVNIDREDDTQLQKAQEVIAEMINN